MDIGVCAEPRYMTVSTREFASLLHLPLYIQKRTIRQRKLTYKAPAPKYTIWGPTRQCPGRKAVREAALMGQPNHRVGRPHVGTIRPHLWREDRPYPPEGVPSVFIFNSGLNRPSWAIKGGLPHPLSHTPPRDLFLLHLKM